MPRSRSRSGGFSSGSRSRGFFGTRSSNTATRPMPAQQPMTYSRSPGILSGIGSTMAHGMAFGAGSQVAHQAIRGIMGPSYQPVYVVQGGQGQVEGQHMRQGQQQEQICLKQINDFAQCIQQNDNNIGNCQQFSSLLKQCKQRSERK